MFEKVAALSNLGSNKRVGVKRFRAWGKCGERANGCGDFKVGGLRWGRRTLVLYIRDPGGIQAQPVLRIQFSWKQSLPKFLSTRRVPSQRDRSDTRLYCLQSGIFSHHHTRRFESQRNRSLPPVQLDNENAENCSRGEEGYGYSW
jgi:hypothetical protein